jgi:hypothetical protein
MLASILDYAGMFPPAKLPLADALENFHEYQHHEHADYLSRFVIPVGQVPDLPSAARPPLTVLVKPTEINPSLQELQADSIEVPWDEQSLNLLENCFSGKIFIELDWRKPYAPQMAAISPHAPRFGVKLRTGGVTPESIPPSKVIAEFLLSSAQHKLPRKATAGLHVPVPNDNAEIGARMHGFLNFFCAGFLAYTGRGDRQAITNVLEDFSYEDFSFGEDFLRCGTFEFTKQRSNKSQPLALSFDRAASEPIEHPKVPRPDLNMQTSVLENLRAENTRWAGGFACLCRRRRSRQASLPHHTGT